MKYMLLIYDEPAAYEGEEALAGKAEGFVAAQPPVRA
jgi:hypothetical protein